MKTLITSFIPTLVIASSLSLSAVTGSQLEAQQAAWKESVSHESSKNYKAAISSMKEYISNKGDKYLTSLRMGWLYYSAKDNENAIKYYQLAAKSSRGSVSPLLGLLNTYEQMADVNKQIKMCKSILSLDKSNYTALMKLGALSFTTKDYRTCKIVYEKLYEAYPEDPAAISGYAWTLVYLSDQKKALPLFTKLMSMSPDYSYAEKGYKLCGGN